MKNINKYRKDFADLRDSILVEISSLIRKQPNWYLKIQDVRGKLKYQELNSQESEICQSITVKDFGDHGEQEVVWVGVHEEDYYVSIAQFDIDHLINILEAMIAETEE